MVIKRINDVVFCVQLSLRNKPKVVHCNRLWRYSGASPLDWLDREIYPDQMNPLLMLCYLLSHLLCHLQHLMRPLLPHLLHHYHSCQVKDLVLRDQNVSGVHQIGYTIASSDVYMGLQS